MENFGLETEPTFANRRNQIKFQLRLCHEAGSRAIDAQNYGTPEPGLVTTSYNHLIVIKQRNRVMKASSCFGS